MAFEKITNVDGRQKTKVRTRNAKEKLRPRTSLGNERTLEKARSGRERTLEIAAKRAESSFTLNAKPGFTAIRDLPEIFPRILIHFNAPAVSPLLAPVVTAVPVYAWNLLNTSVNLFHLTPAQILQAQETARAELSRQLTSADIQRHEARQAEVRREILAAEIRSHEVSGQELRRQAVKQTTQGGQAAPAVRIHTTTVEDRRLEHTRFRHQTELRHGSVRQENIAPALPNKSPAANRN